VTLTNNSAPFSWNAATQTGNIPQSPTLTSIGSTYTFTPGNGAAPVTFSTLSGVSADAGNQLTLGTDTKPFYLAPVRTLAFRTPDNALDVDQPAVNRNQNLSFDFTGEFAGAEPVIVAQTATGLSVENRRFVNDTIYVDFFYGSDSLGVRERADLPFLTSAAAITAAQNGDRIVFRGNTAADIVVAGKQLVLDTTAVTTGADLTLTNASGTILVGATNFANVVITSSNSLNLSTGQVQRLSIVSTTNSSIVTQSVTSNSLERNAVYLSEAFDTTLQINGYVTAPLTNVVVPTVSYGVTVSGGARNTIHVSGNVTNLSTVADQRAVFLIDTEDSKVIVDGDIHCELGTAVDFASPLASTRKNKVKARNITSKITSATSALRGLIRVDKLDAYIECDLIMLDNATSDAAIVATGNDAKTFLTVGRIKHTSPTGRLVKCVANTAKVTFMTPLYYDTPSTDFALSGGGLLEIYSVSRFATNQTTLTPTTAGAVAFPDFQYAPNVSIPPL